MVGYRFNTIGVSDGISMGTDGMSFSLQSRWGQPALCMCRQPLASPCTSTPQSDTQTIYCNALRRSPSSSNK
jgi:membrane protein involved in colicin uptake